MYQIFRVIPFQRFPLKPRYLSNYTLFQLISTEKKTFWLVKWNNEARTVKFSIENVQPPGFWPILLIHKLIVKVRFPQLMRS